MKIYQIHESGGEWDDSFDRIVESWMNEEDAEKRKVILQLENEDRYNRVLFCARCPLFNYDCKNKVRAALARCNQVTPDRIMLYENGYGYFCEERAHDGEQCYYTVIEEEVYERL